MRRNRIRENNAAVLSLISVLLSVYILLFEFIIPANKFLPKPSILLDSLPVLFIEYDFLSSFLYTFSAIYAIMLLSYFLIVIGHKILFSFSDSLPGLINYFIIGRYILPIFLIILFNQWFDNFWGEYLFILIIIMGTVKAEILRGFYEFPEEYIDSARSLGLNRKEIITKVIFKYLQPKIIDTFGREHILLFGWIIVYEYINMNIGVGYVFAKALEYNDLSIIIILVFFLILTLLSMDLVFNQIKKSNFFWK